jgi:hypothetical protein
MSAGLVTGATATRSPARRASGLRVAPRIRLVSWISIEKALGGEDCEGQSMAEIAGSGKVMRPYAARAALPSEGPFL